MEKTHLVYKHWPLFYIYHAFTRDICCNFNADTL